MLGKEWGRVELDFKEPQQRGREEPKKFAWVPVGEGRLLLGMWGRMEAVGTSANNLIHQTTTLRAHINPRPKRNTSVTCVIHHPTLPTVVSGLSFPSEYLYAGCGDQNRLW